MIPESIAEIGREMSIARKGIPYRNRAKFDIEAEDHFRAICEAHRAGDMERVISLRRLWAKRLAFLSGEPDCRFAPPCLVRRIGETDEAYRNRCYQAGRWM